MEGSRFGIERPSADWQARNPGWDRTRPDDPGWTPDPKDAAGDLRKAESERKRQLPILFFDAIKAVMSSNDFVGGLLIEGSAAVVYGDSNTGKTFWTLDLSLHVASGKPWNGRRVERGGVLYVVMEGTDGFRNRVAAWREHRCEPGDQPLFAAVPASINLREEDGAGALVDAAKQAAEHWGQPVKLIVIDTVARALAGGDESGSVDMGALVQMVDLIRKETGACVLLIHHSGKDPTKGGRGHSSLRGAVDTEIEIKAGDDGLATATVTKQRDLQKGDRFGFRLETVILGQNTKTGENVTTCVVMPTDAPTAELRAGAKLNAEAETLRRAIVDMVADGEAQPTIPEPGMPEVPAIPRKRLQEALLRNGWLRTVPAPGQSQHSDPHSEHSVSHSGGWKVPDSEHTKLWRKLNDLKAKGIIGHNRAYVWLARS